MHRKISSNWKKVKRSGAFRRKVKSCLENMLIGIKNTASGPSSTHDEISTSLQQSSPVENYHVGNVEGTITEMENETRNNWLIELNEPNEPTEDPIISDEEKNAEFRKSLRHWAVSFNIPHSALSELFKIENLRVPNILPRDPRTLLRTYQSIPLIKVGNGSYWHNGFEFCLRQILPQMTKVPEMISLNVNIDGLPIYKSSKCEFWPILFNIKELPAVRPMIIGIYCGPGKPSDLNAYLQPFVEEGKTILSEGLMINNTIVSVKLCFVCDSPARALIKGVTNFNGKQGCLKCTTVGEYSYISHTVFFPMTGCARRTDDGFRAKMYGSHHKKDTPLLSLPIDMIEDFPVGDSLHLIDLGIMKKCLLGWRDGSFGNYRMKWCAKDIASVSTFLENCKMPSEIHRAVRGLEVLAHWKGSEYRTFLHYLGIVILKDVLPSDVYNHFLCFFCAVTICSSNFYSHFLDLAETLLNHYVEYYRDFYGEDYMTSNVHNLSHLVDEVRRFGPLFNFNAYPFESRLYQIKNLLRNGNSPLSQVAKRMSEIMQIENDYFFKRNDHFNASPLLRNKNRDQTFAKVEFSSYFLAAGSRDKWFLTNDNRIVAMQNAFLIDKIPYVKGTFIKDLNDMFVIPIKSSYLNIFKWNCREMGSSEIYPINNIKCKMVATEYKNKTVFFPLLHTLLN